MPHLLQRRGVRTPQRFFFLPWLLIAIAPPLLGRCGGATGHGSLTSDPAAIEQPSNEAADADAGWLPGACTDLRQTLAARISAAFANVDQTCQRDEECRFVTPDVGCYSACPSLIASQSGARAATATIQQDVAVLCEEFEAQRCEIPPLVCVAGSPVLVCNGTCARVDQLSCEELLARAAAHVTAVTNDASRSCSRDDDCALAPADIRCVPTCGNLQSVATSAVEGLQRAIAKTQGLYCDALESRGCPAQPALPCRSPGGTRATCNAGQCELTYAP